MSDRLATVATSVELALILVGLVLLWRLVLSPTARAALAPPLLPKWEIEVTLFLQFLLFVVGGSFATGLLAQLWLKFFPLVGDTATVAKNVAAQAGLLLGVAAFRYGLERPAPSPAPRLGAGGTALTGAAIFVISLPLVTVAGLVWQFLLKLCGLPVEKQDLITMFSNAGSPAILATMIALAVVIAPVTEELIFRAGLFRYVRGRLPRWAALVMPAVFFAVLHVNWSTLDGLASFAPLAVLAFVFSLAYERTGRIGPSIVAHALFNLHTVVLIFCRVDS
jgi:membrane protease YdiL (CAAX protease family)